MSYESKLPQITPADAAPARKLHIELTTRITTQPLHYRSGDEETAAQSVFTLFGTTRQLLAENAEAGAFEMLGRFLLNELLRPNSARWHRGLTDGRFAGEQSRRQFRYELQQLQVQLSDFAQILKFLAQGPKTQEQAAKGFKALVKNVAAGNYTSLPPKKRASLGAEVQAGVGPEVPFKVGRLGDELGHFASAHDINAAEARFIHARRQALGSEEKGADLSAPVTNGTGICLSGGGIRSATFCLGIIQVLARQRLLQRFDYLSTVSGGGYLGTFLTAFLGTPKGSFARNKNPEGFDGAEIETAYSDAFGGADGRESTAVRHLRNNSRYLLNGGVWGRVRALGLIISGIFTNISILLPVPLLAALAAAFLWHLDFWEASPGSSASFGAASPAGALLLALVFLLAALWFGLPAVRSVTRGSAPGSRPAKLRAGWESAALVSGVLAAGALIVYAIPFLFKAYSTLRTAFDRVPGIGSNLHIPDATMTVIGALAPFAFGLIAARLKAGLLKRITTILFTLSGPLLYLLVFLFVGSRVIDGSWSWWWVLGVSGLLMLWTWFFIDINDYSPHGYYRSRLCECYLAVRGKDQTGVISGIVERFLHGRATNATVEPEPAAEASRAADRKGKSSSGVFGGLIHEAQALVDEVAAKPVRIGTLRQLPLSEMNETGAAPYHLVNTAANLASSQEPNLRGRDCDFFTLTRDYCGGPVCGYIPTDIVEAIDPHVDLGTAMAVSGAAASSNMGTKTIRHMRFFLTLLNIRLGYWLRNPVAGRRRFWNVPGPQYFFREMMGWMHEKCSYLNLSDGGHIENLALYELLRRRCKFIVVVDGGMEPGMECSDLMLAQRYAQIDLGVKLDLDPADLALDDRRLSRAYAVFGKVHYSARAGAGANDTGWLLYLKLATTGGEPGYVVDYRRQNPEFPHQTTGDQIYDEAQFEAYRRLGECAAESLFRAELSGRLRNPAAGTSDEPPAFDSLEAWFQALADNLLVDNDPAFNPARAG